MQKQTLRAWRRAKEISQEEMASRIGVHVNTYQNWEKHPNRISIVHAILIADILGITTDDISFHSTEEEKS